MGSDEETTILCQCINCDKVIKEKPWISVTCNDEVVHGCSYLCGMNFREILGNGYWKNVINKEDFNEPRPVFGFTNKVGKNDITTGFGMDEIREEIKKEEQRIELIEQNYDDEFSDDSSNFDEENYY